MRAASQPAKTPSSRSHRIIWIDGLRVFGALLIFLYHFGGDYQSAVGVVSGTGLFGWLGLLRPHFAEWGISLFVVLSGVSLTLRQRTITPYLPYLRKRALRLLLPLWILGPPYVLAGIVLGEMSLQALWKAPFWFSGLGVLSPETYLPVAQSWWYVTLALQCAAVAPVLCALVHRLGMLTTVIVLAVAEVVTLAAIGCLPADWQYLSQGLVLARLLEIAAGIVAGFTMAERTNRARVGLPAAALLGASTLAEHLGAVTSVTTIAVWGLVVGSCSLVLAGRYLSSKSLSLVALGTYPFYLVHAPIGKYSIRALSLLGVESETMTLVTALGLSVCAAAVTMAAEKHIRSAVRGKWG